MFHFEPYAHVLLNTLTRQETVRVYYLTSESWDSLDLEGCLCRFSSFIVVDSSFAAMKKSGTDGPDDI